MNEIRRFSTDVTLYFSLLSSTCTENRKLHSDSKGGRVSSLLIKSRWTEYRISGYLHHERGISQSRAIIAELAAKPRHRARDLFVPDEPTILEIAGEGSESSYYAARIVGERAGPRCFR